MKRHSEIENWWIFSILSIALLAAPAVAADAPLVGGQLPEFTLPVPESSAHRAYLGVSAENENFTIPTIADPVAIIEIFSMYCPHCQREAPIVNQLYELIQNSPDLKGKIKLIGIGVGNTRFEVDYFRDAYDIPFPLFPDPDFTLHSLMGEVRTPFFVGIKKIDDGGHEIIYAKLGGFGEPGEFLDLILQKSELQ